MTKQEARERLAAILQPGDTVHTILRHVSTSGMVRDISPVLVRDGDIMDLTYWTSVLTDRRVHNNGVRYHGAGMDTGFELVYNLSQALWPQGFNCIAQAAGGSAPIGKHCPSSDHVNPGNRDRVHHPDGGYALGQRWL